MSSNPRIRKAFSLPPLSQCLAIIAVCLLISCSATKILKEETAPGVDLSAYKSFNFYTVTAAGDTTPRKADQRMNQLRQAIRTELEGKGYAFSIDKPDFLVNVFMRVKQDVQTREKNLITDPPSYAGQRNYSWQAEDVVVGYYKTGLMDIHIIDAKENRLVWESESDGTLADKESQVPQRMAERMKKVFAHFPQARLPQATR
jgi:hypothetical protein